MLGGNVSLNPQPLKLNFLDDGEMSIIAQWCNLSF